MYNPPNLQCYDSECNECKDVSHLKNAVLEHFRDEEVVMFTSWVSTDRTSLESLSQNPDEFA